MTDQLHPMKDQLHPSLRLHSLTAEWFVLVFLQSQWQAPRYKQVSQTVSACSYYLRHINQSSLLFYQNRQRNAEQTKECVVNAIITSRLDYYKALLYGPSVVNIARLQRMHNSAARLIMRRPRSDSARPLLQELHWLLVARRVDFKILVLIYKAMHDEAPTLPAVTVWKWSALVPRLAAARSFT